MQRLMGHDAYAAMVAQMRAVLGDERANAMLAHYEAAMASVGAGSTSDMSQMMSGMRGMMSAGR